MEKEDPTLKVKKHVKVKLTNYFIFLINANSYTYSFSQ